MSPYLYFFFLYFYLCIYLHCCLIISLFVSFSLCNSFSLYLPLSFSSILSFAMSVFISMFPCLSLSRHHSVSLFLCLCSSLSLSLSVPFGCLSLFILVLFCVYIPMSPSLSATPFPGWLLSLVFFSCERLSGAGAPERAPRSARRSLGTTSRGRAAPAHCHRSCLCSAGSLYCGSSPLWAKATQGPCYSLHRATRPKTGGWHLPHPLASAGPPGQS